MQKIRLFLSLLLLGCSSSFLSGQGVHFGRDMAPAEGIVKPQEDGFREEICINGTWDFQVISVPADWDVDKGKPPELALPDASNWEVAPIKIPSPWNVNSILHDKSGGGMDSRTFPSYPEHWNQAKMGWLRKKVVIPASWKDKEVFIHLKAVAGDCRILVNREEIVLHFDNALPGEYNITEAIEWGEENELLLGIRDAKLYADQGKYGKYTYPTGSFWLENAIGVWQDLFLLAKPKVHIRDVFVQANVQDDLLVAEVELVNNTNKKQKVELQMPVFQWINQTDLSEQNVLKAPEISWTLGAEVLQLKSSKIVLEAGQKRIVSLKGEVKGSLKKWEVWSRGEPNLYAGIAELSSGKKAIDKKYQRFGWRDVEIKNGDFFLNGERLELMNEGWHFTGVPCMTRRYAWGWYTLSKAAHVNLVRPHAMPYPDYFYDMADEMGMLIMDETGIFGSHVNFNYESPEFWERNQKHIESLVRRDRNHPSIIGWSVANEVRAVLIWQAVDDLEFQQQIYDSLSNLTEIAHSLDPTRQWLQSDGDKDLDRRLDVYTIHTGDQLMEKIPENKLWGVTEGGSSYYGKPGYYEKYVGDRTYRSFHDRMDALAMEDYNLIKTLRAHDADISNTWNLVWHGLKPLAVGLEDSSVKELLLSDGVFFGPYVEGKPGIQPERLAPFSLTVNPGYDPNLPLYYPYPLYSAIQAANHPDGPQACEWDHFDVPAFEIRSPETETLFHKVLFVGDEKGHLYKNLEIIGVPFTDQTDMASFLIIEVAAIEPDQIEDLKTLAESIISKDGTVFLTGLSEVRINTLNDILPASINCVPDEASSLLPSESDPRTASISLGDLYFAENSVNKLISSYSLGGDFVEKGNTLIYRNNTDWRRWFSGGESSKTISIYRSELENQKTPVLVEYSEGKGSYLVSTIELESMSDAHIELFRLLLNNLGIKLNDSRKISFASFEGSSLTRALTLGRFGAKDLDAGMDSLYLAESSVDPVERGRNAGLNWIMAESDGDQILLKNHNQSGPQEVFVCYFSYWIFSPLDLSDLLNSGPDMPSLSHELTVSRAARLFLNGQVIGPSDTEKVDYRIRQNYRSIPLKQGWNHFLIKVVTDAFDRPEQGTIGVRMESNNKSFEEQLKTAIQRPQSK